MRARDWLVHFLGALAEIDAEFTGVIVSDIRMPHIDGHQLFGMVQSIDPEIPVILISGHADVSEAMEAMRRGAYDFIVKPYSDDQLAQCIKRALEKRQLVLDNRRLRELADEAASSWPLIGQNPAMEQLRKTLRQVAEADVDTLIEGETGVGKELAARALHTLGPRRRNPSRHITRRREAHSLMALDNPVRHTARLLADDGVLYVGRIEHRAHAYRNP